MVPFATTPYILDALGDSKFGAYALIDSSTAHFGIFDREVGSLLIVYMTLLKAISPVNAEKPDINVTAFGVCERGSNMPIGLNTRAIRRKIS